LLIGLLTIVSLFLPGSTVAQNIVSGEITGTVFDTTGAVLPNATVLLTSGELGLKMATTTSASGMYRFPLLRPAVYKVTVSAPGFGTVTRDVVASLGQVTPANIHLGVSGRTVTIQVDAEAELIHTESANLAETLDSRQVELLPNSGGDLTNYALTTPGVVLSTGAGYGNFTSNGIGGMSNLYTINGNDYNDAYLNLNNSGASNMLLGSNEVQEATVVTNGYTAQYGRMAGSNLNFTTKSGSNSFHGNASWLWNGAILNVNDWFNKTTSPITPRPHAVSNQWAGSLGGFIAKNKIFFFYDNEGIRYVLPSGGPVYIPSMQFENAVLANLNTASPASVNFYTKAFSVYNKAPAYSRATPVTAATDSSLGCGDIYNTDANGNPISSSVKGISVGTACALGFQDTTNNLNTERLQTIRVDFNLTSADKLNLRYKGDRGLQATSTDPINSAFSANSIQPQDEGQMNWIHLLNSNMVNQFIASGLYYSAKFGPPNFSSATAVFPTSLGFTDGLFYGLGNFSGYPQGRNVTQYQFVDDFTWTKGRHGIKFGMNYRRNDITDFSGSSGLTGLATSASMTSFANGLMDGGTFTQVFSKTPEVPVAYYSLGLYVQDEWRVNKSLKLTVGLRLDRNSDEVCEKTCFSRPTTNFGAMDHGATTPYNASIKAVSTAFPNLESAVWGPARRF